MKAVLKLIAIACLLSAVAAYAQNWATVSAANITDLNQNKLAAGQLCFLGTDQNDNPISFSVGGGGQVLKRAFCSSVVNGAVTAFTVPNPANTSPSGIYYRVTVKDTSTGLEVLRYAQVTFSGGAFSFDNYAPANLGNFAPLSGNAVSGNLSVSGNASITGSLTAGSFSPTVLTSGQFTSNTVNPAGAGILRLASGDGIAWRNNANSANLALAKTGAAAGGVPADVLDASAFGGLKLASPAISAEAAAPSGVVGSDVLYADATAHRWKMINNNGAADSVQGAATADTLSNKTLTGPSNGNSVTLLSQQGPVAALTGNSSDQTVYSYTVKANTLAAGKGIKFTMIWIHSTGTGAPTYKLTCGSTPIDTFSYGNSSTSAADHIEFRVFNNPGSQTSQNWEQIGTLNSTSGPATPTAGVGTSSVDWTVDEPCAFTFNAASTDKITGKELLVELIQ